VLNILNVNILLECKEMKLIKVTHINVYVGRVLEKSVTEIERRI